MEQREQIKLSKGCLSLQVPPLGILPKAWNELCRVGQVQNLPPRHQVCTEGETVTDAYLILDGYTLLQKSSKTIDIIEPSESLGAGLLQVDMAKAKYPVSATTITPCEVLKIRVSALVDVLQKFPDLNLYFFTQIQKRMFFLQTISVIAKMPVAVRVAHFLITKQHLLEHDFITRKLMGEILNTTTESVIRTLSDFVNMGYIIKKKKKTIITEKLHSYLLCQKTV